MQHTLLCKNKETYPFMIPITPSICSTESQNGSKAEKSLCYNACSVVYFTFYNFTILHLYIVI